MTRLPSLACTAAALLLIFGLAVAAEQAEAEPAKPAVADSPDNPTHPKKETANPTSSSQSTPPAAGTEEPDCN